MPDRIKIDVPAFKGEYEFDMVERPLNGFELSFIRQISGVRLGEIEEAIGAGDYELIVALAVCALYRAGKVQRTTVRQAADMILEGGIDATIDYIVEPAKEEEGERDLAPSSDEPAADESNVRSISSSPSSEPSSDAIPETGPPPTGTPDSDSAESV